MDPFHSTNFATPGGKCAHIDPLNLNTPTPTCVLNHTRIPTPIIQANQIVEGPIKNRLL